MQFLCLLGNTYTIMIYCSPNERAVTVGSLWGEAINLTMEHMGKNSTLAPQRGICILEELFIYYQSTCFPFYYLPIHYFDLSCMWKIAFIVFKCLISVLNCCSQKLATSVDKKRKEKSLILFGVTKQQSTCREQSYNRNTTSVDLHVYSYFFNK